jgi:hypothetical protein
MGERASLALTAAALALALASACTTGPPGAPGNVACDAASTCPADPPLTDYQVNTCRDDTQGACGTAYQAYEDCYAASRVCAYGGTTDVLLTTQACHVEAVVLASCMDAGTD